MPKIVDHEEQRRLFAKAAMRLIAREGLEGMTMRAVAKEAGLSYGSLFHYFSSKDELLMHAVEDSMQQQTERVNEYSSRYAGLAALEQLMCDDAIIEGSSREGWLIWQAFLYKAAMQPSFAAMHAELIDGWLGRFRRHLLDAQMAGEISETLDVEFEARALWAYSAGIGQMGLLDPVRLPPDLQKKMISTYLERLPAAA
jgi:AcrR family transcriptional regulator